MRRSTRAVVVGFAALATMTAGQGAARAARTPAPLRAATYLKYFEAQQLMAEGRNDEARVRLEEVLAADPSVAVVHSELARLCLRAGDLLCAQSRGERAVELDPREADGHRVLADVDLQRYQQDRQPAALDEALAHLSAAVDAAPLDGNTWATWIRTLVAEGRSAEGEAIARRAASIPGLDPAIAWLTLARSHLARGETDRAIAVLTQADVTGRSAAPILETLADLLGSRGDLAGQATALERLRAMRPDDADLAQRLGTVRLDLGDFFGAESPLRDAFDARPADPLVRRDLARVLVRLGRGAEALDLLSQLPSVYRAPHTLMLSAQAAEQADRFADAADRLEELLTLLSADDRASFGPSVRLRAARNRERAGQPDRVLALTEDLADDPGGLRLRLAALDALGRGREADALLSVRLAERAEDVVAIALATERADRADRERGGFAAGSAAIARAKDAPRIALQVAGLLTVWDRPRLAARLLDAFPASIEWDNAGLRAFASTMSAAGRAADAERVYRRVLERDANDHAALNDLGYMLTDNDRALDEALAMLKRAVELKPDEPAYLDSLAWALHRSGRSADALPLLKKAVRRARDRDEAGIREHLGDVYLALGDRARARAEWNAAIALGAPGPDALRRKIGAAADAASAGGPATDPSRPLPSGPSVDVPADRPRD